MLEKMKEILAEMLDIDPADITENASFSEDLGADSLDLFEMVVKLQDEYHFEIPMEDLEKIKTVGDAVNYFKDHNIGG